VCQHCKEHDARFVSRRLKTFVSLFGTVRFPRCYYHCVHCKSGTCPWDQILGLNEFHLTPAAAEVASLAGVQASFEEASLRTLRIMAGLRLSESTVERVTEATGERVAQHLQAKQTFGAPQAWEWQRDAQGRTCAYVSLDMTGIRQQGARGARAEGRMATVGMLYNPRSAAQTLQRRPASVPHQVRYLAGFYDLDDLGLELRRQAAQVGWDDAEQQIALSDGGSGLEEFFRKNFPKAECILDFWHAKEYLVELAQALWGAGQPDAQAWLDEQCHRLKHEGGAAVLAMLEEIDVASRSANVRESHRQVTNYFRNHSHRMDYPRYLARGWQIGSGPIESACKTVVGNRLKGGGMRWGSPGSDAVCHLRALYLSEPSQWEALWRDHPN
jgi:hypothetical protein